MSARSHTSTGRERGAGGRAGHRRAAAVRAPQPARAAYAQGRAADASGTQWFGKISCTF